MELWKSVFAQPIVAITVAGVIYAVSLAAYRLWFSPLARFPGPKLAALTMWYEFYYDSFLEGQYTFRIAEMHRKYGPIVRISPFELHIDDPDYYEILYSQHKPMNKSILLTGMFGAPASAFGSVDHRRHRIRRQPMNPFFSQQRIRQLEPMIRTMVDKLCKGMRDWKERSKPLHVYHAFNAYTTDVVVEYTMGESFHYLDDPDFTPQWSKTIEAIVLVGMQLKQFRWVFDLFELLPRWLVLIINSDVGPVIDQRLESLRLANLVIDSQAAGGNLLDEKVTVPKGTLFHALLDSKLPPEEKTAGRLSQEVFTVISAGGETTAKNLTTLTFHLLNNPDKLQTLRDELSRLDPDGTATLVEYEAIPYLTSVMLEGLRITNAVGTRLQRSSPAQAMTYKDWVIPPGTHVGMTSLFMHHNEDIFPDSQSFIPERWIDPAQRKALEKYLVPFSKGSRQCIGIPLARAMILLAIATIFREFDLELYETTVDDVRIVRDMFVGHPRKGSQSVRVMVNDRKGHTGQCGKSL
ncbi:Cytochrome P450 E-class group I [Penicillium cf. griseofulvum]|uniref:Cytochrome P450 E-class group I n=1 Tax=Penicillium cf. griseofulvum TaxID=2972120 RepID=A0A9W9MSG5_9EURO|nr:Cytochrome P450 E-class group I [Penicillium cf. griseofulvum]KAJ5440450.1 Cytochrome P450 E-class group I [Penicillium cf. griseofulvum]KAJ5448497.1 Cytochrome P450 E-class group I [Penicillium cf. griseofulvum]